ncbi:MAG: SMI1/KNR4 family protein [Planctomycetaceae bacterium]|nr:SMI1/KNR4 family protein [Planctomycetaceae bacterium]
MWDLDQQSPNEPLTDAILADAEARLNVRFPADYVAALRQKNGGATIGQYFRLPKQEIPSRLVRYVDHGHISVAGINGIGTGHESVLQTQYMTEEWQLPKGLVLLDGDGHTWIAFDYRATKNDPRIVFLESDSGDTLFVAANFTQFFSGLVPHESLFDDDGEFIGTLPDSAA